MAKSKRNQNTTKPLSTMQTPHSYSLSSSADFSSTNVVQDALSPAAPGEEAGVCVVCEDECTCGAAAAAASKATTTTLSNKKRLILKISKPNPHSALNDAPEVDSPHSIQSSSFPAPVPHFDSPPSRIGASGPKKRGRPSKADINARQTAARAARAALPSAARRGVGVNNSNNRVPSSSARPIAPISAPTSNGISVTLSSSGVLPTFVPASVFGSDSSLSSPSSESDDDSSSSSSSDDLLDDDDTDSEVEAEEERMIVQETLAMQKLRARRELEKSTLEADAGGRRRWDKMHWTNREPRHGSVGADNTISEGDSSSDDDSNSGSSGDDEQEDDDGEDDNEDPELDVSSAPGYEWSDDEDDFDADVFFANLSDSSFDSSSSDSEPEQPSRSRSHAAASGGMSLAEAVEAGLVSELELQHNSPLPLVVTENWDGQLVFAHEIKDSDEMIDLIFGTATAVETDAIMSEADSVRDTDEQDTEDAETDAADEDDYEEFGDDLAAGDTTDEDELHPELGPILFAHSPFDAPPKVVSGNPSIFSSNRGTKHRRENSKSTTASLRLTPAPSSSSGSQLSESGRLIPAIGSFTISVDTPIGPSSAIIDGSRAAIIPSPYPRPQNRKRRPTQQNTSTSRSPKRVRQSSHCTTPTPHSPQVPNFSNLAEDTESGNSAEDTRLTSSPRSTPQPIGLDDVLHILDDELSDDPGTASDATAGTKTSMHSRWDRIPFNAFHRLRSASDVHSGVLGSPINTTITMASAASLSSPHRPNPREFSFRPPSSSVTASPYAEYGSFWDNSSPQSSPRAASAPSRSRSNSLRDSRRDPAIKSLASKMRLTEREKRKMLVSPVLLPTKDEDFGDRSHPEIDVLNLGGGGATPTQRRSPSAVSKRGSSFNPSQSHFVPTSS